jgi:hypothetical protein
MIGLLILAISGVSGCGHSPRNGTTGVSESTTKATSPSTTSIPPTVTSTATSTETFAMETCGGILTDQNLRPAINLQGLLLNSHDVPVGYTTKGPQSTGTVGTEFSASVPSTVPVWFIQFEMGSSTAPPNAASETSTISETIGEVDSAQTALQQVARIQAAAIQAQCLPDGHTVAIPGSVPNLAAIEGFGGSRAGSIAGATVLVAKGPYVVNVMWGVQSSSQTPTPTLPTPSKIGSIVEKALTLIPG